MSDKMPITSEVLVWARKRSGQSLDYLISRFPMILAWEKEEDQPSYAALCNLANLYKIPVALFFMPSPPQEIPLNQKFRTLPQSEIENLPVALRKLLRDAQAMQLNLDELYEGINPAEKKIFSDLQFEINTPIKQIADKVREYLSITVLQQSSWADEKVAFEKWRDILIDHGIYVFKDAFKDNSFSGFCLYDKQFPLIYVNNSTTLTRQIFTLFHELAHLLFKTGGIDKENNAYVENLSGDEEKIEIICNLFSGAFLVPDDDFDQHTCNLTLTNENFILLASRYKVSREVILRKMLDRKLISSSYYKEKKKEWDKQFNQSNQKGGGNYYHTKMSYLGRKYLTLVLAKYHQEKITNIQLGEYLNIKPKNIGKFEETFLRGRI